MIWAPHAAETGTYTLRVWVGAANAAYVIGTYSVPAGAAPADDVCDSTRRYDHQQRSGCGRR